MHVHVQSRRQPLNAPFLRLRGFGDTAALPTGCTATAWSPVGSITASQCEAPSGSAGGASISQKTGSIVSGAGSVAASLLALSPATGPAAPFVAIGAGLVAFATNVLGIGSGCGQACIDATKVANYAECIMQVNINTYMALAPPRYLSQQAAALTVFDQAWSYLQQGCGVVPGSAGKNCISERNRGGKYDYFARYRDQIASDKCVIADPTPVDAVTGAATTAEGAVSSAVSAITSLTGGGSSSLILPLLLLVAGAVVLSQVTS